MAFDGRLLKFGNYEFPLQTIVRDSYNCTPNQRQDLDSHLDGDGFLRRYALSHTRSKIEFETVPMDGVAMDALLANLRANYINYNERNANGTYFDNENGVYRTGMLYMADPKFTVGDCNSSGWIWYKSVRFAFVEY